MLNVELKSEAANSRRLDKMQAQWYDIKRQHKDNDDNDDDSAIDRLLKHF